MRVRFWRIFSSGLLVLLLIAVISTSALTWHWWDTIKQGHQRHTEEGDLLQQKLRLYKDLRTGLGYGGFIHAFKNFVLRGEEPLAKDIEQYYQNIKTTLSDYEQSPLTEPDRSALQEIHRTLDTYYANFQVVRDAKVKGLSAEQIDAQVRVDDTNALIALQILGTRLHQDLAGNSLSHQQNTSHIKQLSPVIMILTGILTLVSGIILVFSLRMDRNLRRARESEALYRNILDTAIDSIISINAKGIIQSVNPACERIFGYSVKELQGRNVNMLMPEPYASQHDGYLTRYLREGGPHIIGVGRTVPARRKDGSLFTAELSVSESANGSRHLFIGILRDISWRVELETELQRQKVLFEAIFHDSADALVVTDTQRQIIMCNPALLDMFGYCQAEIVGQSTRILYADANDFERTGRVRFNLTAAKSRAPYLVQYRDKDGHFFTGETVGTPLQNEAGETIGFLGSIRDVTARITADTELERHRANLAEAQRLARLGSWEWDIVKQDLYWSDEIYRIFGFEPQKFKPTHHQFLDTVYVEDRELLQVAEEAALKGHALDVEHRIIGTNGQLSWVHQLGEVQLDEFGNPLKMSGTLQDITERKLGEQARQRQTASLRVLSELAADPGYRFGDKLQKALAMTLDHLGLELGIISHIQPPQYTVEYVETRSDIAIHKGQQFVLGDTYCDLVVKCMDALAISRMSDSEYNQHPCYKAKLETYIGSPFKVRGEFYGTVNFSSAKPYPRQFDAADLEFIRILSRWCGTVIERAWAYDELHQSEERFQRSQQFANIGTWDWNIQTGELYWSARIGPLFGYAEGELATTYENFLGAIHEDDRNLVVNAVNVCVEQGLEYNIEHRVVWPDGTIRWLSEKGDVVRDSKGKALKMLGVVQDVTQRRLYQEQLARFEQVIESTSHAIGIADMEGLIVYTNQAHQALLNDPSNRALGMNWENLVPEHAAPKLAQIYEGFQQYGGWRGLLPVKIFGGGEFIAYSTVGTVFDDNGKPQFIYNIFYDYSAEMDRQQELQDARDEAERANRAKSEFLSSMSHELRTPLNSVLGFAQLLANSRKEPLSERQQGHVGHILKSGRHLLELITEVLDFAKIEAGRLSISLESVSSGMVVSESVNLLSALAEQRKIDIIIASSLQKFPTICADRTRFRQVLINLLSNAIKYNHDNGSVEVGWEAGSEGRVRFLIKDSGQGIKTADQTDLFQPFNRLHAENSNIEGTGIGLALSKQLMLLMGGEIGCDSDLGKGSTFWVEFPLLANDNATLEVVPPPDNTHAAKTYCGMILYVEDNPANMQLMEEIIAEETDFQLLSAPTAEIGLSLARQHQPDLIILDINLPGMDGIQAMRTIKADPAIQHIPVLALSANVTHHMTEKALEAGFLDYLSKPLDVDALLSALDTALHNNTP